LACRAVRSASRRRANAAELATARACCAASCCGCAAFCRFRRAAWLLALVVQALLLCVWLGFLLSGTG